jgi:hypothetical protein
MLDYEYESVVLIMSGSTVSVCRVTLEGSGGLRRRGFIVSRSKYIVSVVPKKEGDDSCQAQ